MVDIPKYLNAFYPNIYKNSTNTEIQAVIYLQNFMLHWIQQEIEKKLQQWTVTNGVPEEYLKQLLQRIRIPLGDSNSILSLANQKKVINQMKLLTVLQQVYQFKNVQWNDDNENKIFTYTIQCLGEEEEYEKQKLNVPTILRYLQVHLMANYKVFVNLQFSKQIKDYVKPGTTTKYTIGELKQMGLTIGQLKKLRDG